MRIVRTNKDSRQTVNHFAPLLWCEQLNRHYYQLSSQCLGKSRAHPHDAVLIHWVSSAIRFKATWDLICRGPEVFTRRYVRASLVRWKAPRAYFVWLCQSMCQTDMRCSLSLQLSSLHPCFVTLAPLISSSRHHFLSRLWTAKCLVITARSHHSKVFMVLLFWEFKVGPITRKAW